MIKKTIAVILTVTMLFGTYILSVSADSDTKNGTDKNGIVSATLHSYGSGTDFEGKEITPDFSLEDYCILSVDDHGGTHTSENTTVYSNFVTVSMDFRFDESHRIGDDVTIVPCKSRYVDGSWVGKSGKHKIDTKIGYGTIIVTRERQNGSREVYEYIHFNGDSRDLSQLSFTEDGNYHVSIFFSAKKNGTEKKYVAEYVIPIRSSIYVTDMSGEYHVKDTGFYYDDVKLDFAQRKNLDVYVNGKYATDGYVLKKPQSGSVRYDVTVYNGNFVSERFSITLYNGNDGHFFVYGANLKRRLGENVYEAEDHFKLTWNDFSGDLLSYVAKDGGDEELYTTGKIIDRVGTYIFRFYSESLKLNSYYVVILKENTAPSYNYGVLSANRFNNFITKWYEVYDDSAELYYCFHIGEYGKAYEAALSVEKKKVVTYGSGYKYNDIIYADSVSLTDALNASVKEKIKLVYYDVDNSTEEKYFSNNLFDGAVYLNPDFQFVRNHPSETDSVVMTDESGREYQIDFFTEISSYGLADGVYKVTEADLYGNVTEYYATVDSSAPTLALRTDDSTVEVFNEGVYQARYFGIDELFDGYDDFAVVSVNNSDFYLASEYANAVYSESGNYFVKAYDRNGNVIRCIVNIPEKESFYSINETDRYAELILSEGVLIEKAYVDSAERTGSENGTLRIERGESEKLVTVYTVNAEGLRDCVSFKVAEKESSENADPHSNDGEGYSAFSGWFHANFLWMLISAAAVAVVGAVIILIFRKRGARG